MIREIRGVFFGALGLLQPKLILVQD